MQLGGCHRALWCDHSEATPILHSEPSERLEKRHLVGWGGSAKRGKGQRKEDLEETHHFVDVGAIVVRVAIA